MKKPMLSACIIALMVMPAPALSAPALSAPALAASAQAQAEQIETEQARRDQAFVEALSESFKNIIAEDTTPIPEDQLTLGTQVAAKLLPEGSYRRIMSETMGQTLGPMFSSFSEVPLSTITNMTGISESELNISDDTSIGDIMAIFDPAFEERQNIIINRTVELLIDFSDDIEPAIRNGVARAYARRFTAAELNDLIAFLSTETGRKFGAESLAIFSSKEVTSATLEKMPQFMTSIFAELSDIEALTADLPPARTIDELSDEELEKLSQLLGVPAEDLGPEV